MIKSDDEEKEVHVSHLYMLQHFALLGDDLICNLQMELMMAEGELGQVEVVSR